MRRCQRCGQNRRVPEEIGRHGLPTCRDCTAERHRTYNREWMQRHRGRRCMVCGGPKPEGRGRKTCDRCRGRTPRPVPTRRCRCGAELAPGRRTCDACKRERKRQASLAWNRAHRDVLNAAQRRWVARHPERAREATRRWYEAMRADPVAWARHLETHRMGARLLAERNGRPHPPVAEPPPDPQANGNGNGYLHRRLDPGLLRPHLLAWLRAYAAEHPTHNGGRPEHRGLEALAHAATVPERTVFAILTGERQRVHYAVADRLAVVMDLPLALIYEGQA